MTTSPYSLGMSQNYDPNRLENNKISWKNRDAEKHREDVKRPLLISDQVKQSRLNTVALGNSGVQVHKKMRLLSLMDSDVTVEKLQKPEWDNSLIVYPTEEVENKQEKWSEINSNSYTVPYESGNNNENDLNFEFDDNSYTSCEINENHLDRYSSTESIDSNCADYCLNIASTDSFDLDNNRTFFGQSRNPSFDASKPRSIVEIRESLELKVKRLREEKTEVDEKIRLAQEEDVIRSQEKVKFQQQLSIHRKERLRRVIGELKKKLEDQSQRLQTGYNSIILLKRNVTRSRSFVKKNRMQREDSKEAPF